MITGQWLNIAPSWAQRVVSNFKSSGRHDMLTGMFVLGADYYAESSFEHVLDACKLIQNELGLKTIPGFGHMLDSRNGIVGPEAWLSSRTWERTATWIGRVRSLEGETILDLEPYWSSEEAPRYLDRTYNNILNLTQAMDPMLKRIKATGVTPYIMPGTEMATHSLAMLSVEPILLSELSYPISDRNSAVYLSSISKSPSVISGAYAAGLRDPTFQKWLKDKNVETIWYFVRPSTDDWENLGKDSWFDWK